ncbi:hypothetical protein PVAND_009727 [Polypedilum vanderplanki]|uniref:Protein-tyrosine-phosphatase n=1 Tax=Polypedilum vanderplanki TaxID=319348 RepID=A0A9J6CDQ5_POLVA|nr:hypothetical protein PVAND_009727 [Polypedilum vanderplanki]
MFHVEINTKKQEDIENPISVDEIEPRLYLGNVTAATNLNFLKSKKISHILTIDSFPIPNYVSSNLNVTIKYIQIADMNRENILQYFPEAIAFIEDALKDEQNRIIVHCFYGVSRSSTIVIAYLMKKYSISYQHAFSKVKSKRVLCQPNFGFVQQCKLFYKMNYSIDPNCKNYKIFRLKLAAEKIKSAKILPSNFMDLIKPDPSLIRENPEPNVYRCRKCRRIVASKSNLILHKPPKDLQENSSESPASRRKIKAESAQKYLNDLVGETSDQDAIIDITDKVYSTSLSDKSLSEDIKDEHKTEFCMRNYFIEPLTWMLPEVATNSEGKLHCPQCKTKLGSFNWIMASKCGCGSQIFPSFYLVPSKIDFSNVVQNILQVTI